MNIQKIQEEIFGKHLSSKFFTSTKEIKESVTGNGTNKNLLLDLLESPAILPLFNPIKDKDMVDLIAQSDLSITDSQGNNALLLAIDKNISTNHIEIILSKSNLSHKNKDGVNALTLAVINQNLLPTKLLYDIHNSKDESFAKTRKGLSNHFYENRNITSESLDGKYQSMKRSLKKYEERLKEQNRTHKEVFHKFSI